MTPPLLVLMAWGGYLVDSPTAVTAVLTILAAVLGYVVVIDFPFSIDIDEVEREGSNKIIPAESHNGKVMPFPSSRPVNRHQPD